MSTLYRDLFLVVLTAFAEAFLLWVLWHFFRASNRR
jgi:hypothetical protein